MGGDSSSVEYRVEVKVCDVTRYEISNFPHIGISKIRYNGISNVFCPPPPGTPVLLYDGTEGKLRCIKHGDRMQVLRSIRIDY